MAGIDELESLGAEILGIAHQGPIIGGEAVSQAFDRSFRDNGEQESLSL
jgi:hypothetical protein